MNLLEQEKEKHRLQNIMILGVKIHGLHDRPGAAMLPTRPTILKLIEVPERRSKEAFDSLGQDKKTFVVGTFVGAATAEWNLKLATNEAKGWRAEFLKLDDSWVHANAFKLISFIVAAAEGGREAISFTSYDHDGKGKATTHHWDSKVQGASIPNKFDPPCRAQPSSSSTLR